MMIDERGRLFGKINVIDFLVIVFLLFLTTMFYFGYKIFNSKSSQAQAQKQQEKISKEFVGLKIAVRFVKLEPETLGLIAVGDKEKDEDGNVIGEIVSIGGFSPYEREIEIGLDRKLINKDSALRQVDVVLRVNAWLRDKNIYYKDKQIVKGGMLVFSVGKYSVEMEGVTIVKDDYNIVVGKQEKAAVENDRGLEVVRDGLDALEKKVDSSLLQITNRLGGFESKLDELDNRLGELENKMVVKKNGKNK